MQEVTGPTREAGGGRRQSLARLIAGYGAIACALPYLGLKIVWIAGGQLGVAEPGIMRDTSMVALNIVTAGMDLVAIAMALAFTQPWGLRIPAWLVLPPMWVATGLLAKFVVGVPVVVIANALTSGSVPRPTGGPVLPWVYAVVYAEFVGMGVGLMLAFVLYARARWGPLLRGTTGAAAPGSTHGVQVPLAGSASLMAAAVGGLHLAWALGATYGLNPALVTRRTIGSQLVNALDGATAIAAAVGVLVMVHRLGPRLPFWAPLALAWVGSGSLFAWGLWGTINVLGNTALLRAPAAAMAPLNLVGLVRLLAGQVIGLVTLLLLAERSGRDPR